VRKKAAVAGPQKISEKIAEKIAEAKKGTRAQKAEALPGKAPSARRRKAKEELALDALQAAIIQSLEDDKAEDLVTLDLVGRASFADRMVIATGLADRDNGAASRGEAEDDGVRAARDRRAARLGLDAGGCRRYRRASLQAGGARALCS